MPTYIAIIKYLHAPMNDWGPKDPEGKVDKYAHLAVPTLETNEEFFNRAYEITEEIKDENQYETEKF